MSTITCFSGFDESLQDKNAPSNTHCHGRRNGHKGSLQELHGRPWKRDLPAPNTKQSPQCAPVRCIKHPSAQARVANLLSLKLAEIAQQQRFFVSEWKALLKAQWNNKQKKKKSSESQVAAQGNLRKHRGLSRSAWSTETLRLHPLLGP